MSQQPLLPLVVDGFTLNLQWPNCSRWAGFALHQLDALRRSTLYRFHVFTAPEDATATVAQYDTLQNQVRIPPGSWLWAITFAGAFGANAYSVRISEQGTGQLLWSNFFVPGGAFPHGMQILLTEPRVIITPGIVNVEITATPESNSFVQAQLALWCAVPKEARVYQFTECPQPASIRGTEAGGYR